jgi:adenylate cyclase
MKLVLHGSPWRLRFGALVVALLLISLIQWLAPGLLSLAENAVGDYTWRAGASTTMERRVVVVDIDEASLAKVGAWPWSRQTMVKLAERLEAAGAAVQVYDVLFDAEREGDADLAEAFGRVPAVLGAGLFARRGHDAAGRPRRRAPGLVRLPAFCAGQPRPRRQQLLRAAAAAPSSGT